MKGLKPATAEEAFQAKKHVALKKIERDFADETIRGNFDKFAKDARKLAVEFSPEELAMYILTLTVQDPDSLPEVEIAREKPLPFKPSSGGFGGKTAMVDAVISNGSPIKIAETLKEKETNAHIVPQVKRKTAL